MNLKKLFFILIPLFFVTNVTMAIKAPGELSRAHMSLDGEDNCVKCHSAEKRTTRTKCLACHKEIQNNISNNYGYHASVDVRNKECAVCHNEHHGRDFKINRLDKKMFNHNKTGFTLTGKHATTQCAGCHKADFIKNPILKKKDTYLGLSTECSSCHFDFHQGKLSNKCEDCHNTETFKNASGFDHDKTRFPLLGEHRNLTCIKCHPIEIVDGNKAQKLSGLNFANCTGCHKDIHKNKFGQDCKRCHTEESFHFNLSMQPFDHNKTNFKLLGLHLKVNCFLCHKGKSMMEPIKHDQCQDCHKDYHNKEFAVNGVNPDCKTCHTNDGYEYSNFTIAKHNSCSFPLEAAHLATTCKSCHFKNNHWTFRKIGNRCVDCHKDEHKGFLEEHFYPEQDCKQCHNQQSWKKISFDHNGRTNFKREGVHAKTECNKCHYGKDANGMRTQKFKGLDMSCSNCHKDNHKGQFEIDGKTDCSRCHGFENFKPVKFNHDSARFKLEGKHTSVKCNACHKMITNEKGKYRQFKFESIECSSCHGKK
jgi:nitrate/TMAO reductase-like tetraheme cytochrome c subunit